jgi:uncharacterized protein DUF6968
MNAKSTSTKQKLFISREFGIAPNATFEYPPSRGTIVTIKIFQPTKIPGGGRKGRNFYKCRYEILVEGKAVRKFSREGHDSIHALTGAMTLIVNDIENRFPWAPAIPAEFFNDMRGFDAGA